MKFRSSFASSLVTHVCSAKSHAVNKMWWWSEGYFSDRRGLIEVWYRDTIRFFELDIRLLLSTFHLKVTGNVFMLTVSGVMKWAAWWEELPPWWHRAELLGGKSCRHDCAGWGAAAGQVGQACPCGKSLPFFKKSWTIYDNRVLWSVWSWIQPLCSLWIVPCSHPGAAPQLTGGSPQAGNWKMICNLALLWPEASVNILVSSALTSILFITV